MARLSKNDLNFDSLKNMPPQRRGVNNISQVDHYTLKLHKHLARESQQQSVMMSPVAYRNGLDKGGAPLMLQALVGTHSISSSKEAILKRRKQLQGSEKVNGISLESDLGIKPIATSRKVSVHKD
jgi:hypothetical protein